MSASPIHRRALVAGAAIIVTANAVALGGAAYNRSGEPDATLSLTERELAIPYDWGRARDNSGLGLRLQWRTIGAEPADTAPRLAPWMAFSGSPIWLDSAKFASLGFRMNRPVSTPEGRAHYRRQVPKRVLLVMEMNGEAYQIATARMRAWVAHEDSLRLANPTAPEFIRRAEFASQEFVREEAGGSRLFIVDAGRDRAALRALYPDRTRYAIMRGAVRPQVVGPDSASTLEGYITEIAIHQINVPHGFREAFASVRRIERPREEATTSPFSVTVAFGKRLEPWIVAATRGP